MTKQPKRKDPSSTSAPILTDRQLDVLEDLACHGEWARPMDIGGRDASHHSITLKALANRGFAERNKLHSRQCYYGSTHRKELIDNRWVYTDGHPPSTKCCCKGSCRYRILPAGRDLLKTRRP
jgi:hypothetical protein